MHYIVLKLLKNKKAIDEWMAFGRKKLIINTLAHFSLSSNLNKQKNSHNN